MTRAPYLLLIPVAVCVALLPFAARGTAPFSLSVAAVLGALTGWLLIFFVVLGIMRRWRVTRVFVAVLLLYSYSGSFFDFWHEDSGVGRLLIRLACYGFVVWIAYSLAPPLRRNP